MIDTTDKKMEKEIDQSEDNKKVIYMVCGIFQENTIDFTFKLRQCNIFDFLKINFSWMAIT